MSDERGGFLGRLLLLVLLGFGGWYVVTQWWPRNNLERFGGQLQSAIDHELTRFGVTDHDVVLQSRKEHSLYSRLTWVETRRTLRIAGPDRAAEIVNALAHVADHLGCSYETSQTPNGTGIQIKRWIWVLQSITFEQGANWQNGPKAKIPQVAFVIDDVAYETAPMDRFASLGVPLTFAILPREKHSKQLSQKAIAMHFPVMLHLPMEPLDLAHNDPGPTGLYLKMTDQELKSQFDKNIASVPNIVGINNHMGSAFTENEPKMALVLGWVKSRGLYFLDSHTSTHSIVSKMAKRAGVPCLINETFLDNSDDIKSIEHQLDLVMNLALTRGQTIAIGHYRRKFLVQALSEKLQEFRNRGIQIVALPTFYHR